MPQISFVSKRIEEEVGEIASPGTSAARRFESFEIENDRRRIILSSS